MISPAMLFRSGTESTITVHDRKVDAITHNYTVNVSGQKISTTVTKNPNVVTEWINGVNKNRRTLGRLVGLEMEFYMDSSFICTVQVCMQSRCLIYQIREATCGPPSLDKFLANRGRTFVFVGTNVRARMNLLRQQFGFGSNVGNCHEMTELSPAKRGEKMRLMAANAFGDFTNDWARASLLTIPQINHACLDAYFNTLVITML